MKQLGLFLVVVVVLCGFCVYSQEQKAAQATAKPAGESTGQAKIESEVNGTQDAREEGVAEHHFFACVLLYYLKATKDSGIIKSLEAAGKEEQALRQYKIRAMVLQQCVASLPDELVTSV